VTFGGHDPGGRATLLAGVLGLILGLAVLVCGCGSKAATLAPAPHIEPPTTCVQGVTNTGEWVTFCADSLATCKRAQWLAEFWGPRAGLHAVGQCYDRSRVPRLTEQRPEIR
jgi:hypothetical protein